MRLRFLGPVQVERDGKPVHDFRSRKALALLAYLAVQGQLVPRERLVNLFWEDKTEARGRANLSWVLSRISSLLPGCLQADRHTVQFQRPDPSATDGTFASGQTPYWLDILAFEELETQGDTASLADAVELYRGEFLEGLSLDGCAEFEIWLVGERERWRQRMARLLDELLTYHVRRGELKQGLHFARRLLALEPWREATHRQVMRLLAQGGQRGAALVQYETCRRALAEELDVEPAAETTRLFEQIRDGELEIPVSFPARPPSFLDEEVADEQHPLVERPVFVARERELAQLGGFLDTALAGQGRVVFVTGDAGQGKTALIQEFVWRAQSVHPGLVVAGGNGNAHTGIGDPYLPFREVLSLLTGDVEARWAGRAIPREQARRLWHLLPLTVRALVEVGPDLVDTFVPGAALVGRAVAFAPGGADWLARLEQLVERKSAIPGAPGLRQNDLFEQYTRVLGTLVRQRPLLLVLDDLQWADAGSISLLFHLGRRTEISRILIVGAYRPAEVALGRGGERHPLLSVVNELKRFFGDVEVNLDQAEDRRFIDVLLDTEPNRLGGAFRETLYRQTGGHPLFTIELLRGMQERGDLVQDQEGRWVEGPALDWETLPARVEAVITERIGRLAQPLRQALRVASVEGETFTAEVVARVRATDEREMVNCLSRELDRKHRLIRTQGLQRLGATRLSRYRFRHILFQKYLYNNLGEAERAYLHENVGTALETLYGEGAEEIAAIAVQLARHYWEAGIVEKAIDYLRQAGKQAVRMSANEEAIAHFAHGLELVEALPDSPERIQKELALRIDLAAPLQALKGYVAPEVDRTYARARELCRRMGETPQLFPVLYLLADFYSTRGEHHTAHELLEQLLSLAERVGDPVLVALAHWTRGRNLYFLGELTQARAHLEHMIAFYDPQQHHSLAFLYGMDLGMGSLIFASLVLWTLGHPEQALKRSQESLALAQELSHPFSIVAAQGMAAVFHAQRRDAQTAQELAEACIRLSTEQGFSYWLATGICLRGWALAEQGRVEEGIAQMRQGVAGLQATRAEVGHTYRLALLAEAYGKMGQAEQGLTLLAEALAIAHRSGERAYEAGTHQIRGELLLMQEDEVEAEASFHKAIKVASQQSAKSWELRATMSLCRLWQKQGRRQEARKLLAEIYGWFTEGFDTADLKEAKALLEELS